MSSKDVTRILLVEDHPVFREGLRSVLASAPECQVSAEARTMDEALASLELTPVDLVITDIRLATEASGADLIRRLAEQRPELPVLVISMVTDSRDVLAAIAAGARGYLSKEASREEILKAVREVAAGRKYLQSQLAHVVFEMARPVPADDDARLTAVPDMTPRERDILHLLMQGLSPQDVSSRLFLTASTVKTHTRGLYRKFEVGSRTQLVLKALKLGLGDSL